MLRGWTDQLRAALKAGTTVESVARVYGVNPTQIHKWRKQHRQRMQQSKRSALLPVQAAEEGAAAASEAKQECSVTISAGCAGDGERLRRCSSHLQVIGVPGGMIAPPAGARIWIAAGITDLRRGFTGLSAAVQTVLEEDPYGGHARF